MTLLRARIIRWEKPIFLQGLEGRVGVPKGKSREDRTGLAGGGEDQ